MDRIIPILGKSVCVTGLVDPTVANHANHVCRTHNRNSKDKTE